MNTLETTTKNVDGLFIQISLIGYEYFTDFDNKWVSSDSGLVVSEGHTFNCNYYTIGKLKDGADVTPYMAQKEFERDRFAFDVALSVKVFKNCIELFDNNIIFSDYNYDDKTTTKELFNELVNDYYNENEILRDCKETLQNLLK